MIWENVEKTFTYIEFEVSKHVMCPYSLYLFCYLKCCTTTLCMVRL